MVVEVVEVVTGGSSGGETVSYLLCWGVGAGKP